MKITQLILLSLVALLPAAQASLIITIAPDGSGNARMLVTGSGNTVSTFDGGWSSTGVGSLVGLVSTKPFKTFFASGNSSPRLYFSLDFEVAGFQVTAGTQTRTLSGFTFNDDGSRDDLSMGFDATWDTNGAGVGAISVDPSPWQTIRFRNTATYSNPAGEALRFKGNFKTGSYRFSAGDANNFWGGSRSPSGIRLVISTDVIPEPTSALLLLLPATALLRRKRL